MEIGLFVRRRSEISMASSGFSTTTVSTAGHLLVFTYDVVLSLIHRIIIENILLAKKIFDYGNGSSVTGNKLPVPLLFFTAVYVQWKVRRTSVRSIRNKQRDVQDFFPSTSLLRN